MQEAAYTDLRDVFAPRIDAAVVDGKPLLLQAAPKLAFSSLQALLLLNFYL